MKKFTLLIILIIIISIFLTLFFLPAIPPVKMKAQHNKFICKITFGKFEEKYIPYSSNPNYRVPLWQIPSSCEWFWKK